ncbi:hypothetical protein CH306_04340 [Rhodococcus sp. 15-725-2-2b]|uniref:hypothetical protein n=2 Tax=Rhodococcus TaxID=1827 RepID=UPI000B9BCD4C|nr:MULTISPECIES: hypothetical protein [unclassified Rhodococcus (in: high G+C Gram-positive bacteria)]OZC62907.1 hypothetical protein CH277_23575 [Rhodococcus sp. 06-469-3-2]OZD49854.1 hypothetical protein CH264_04110 [Rhodococcus sp. 06-1477-1A]OZE77852.1 hypothetical protein CH306_04340 [Rhodococcus sp. 15-725-2-2b]
MDAHHVARCARHMAASALLSSMSDRELARAVATAAPLGAGIGGRSMAMDLDGDRVFVKRIPLTDIEMLPQNMFSTANVFGLPTFYQYGLGSSGFGAWRELAAHTMTTEWVLGRTFSGFPLMHHWRILPDSIPEGFVDEFGGVERAVTYWERSPAVRSRLKAIGECTHSVVLFLEYVPHTLAEWIALQHNNSDTDDDSMYFWMEDALARGTAFMSAHGLVHFDAHFANILTDGQQLYFADFGLALSSSFDLSMRESTFLARHLSYDSVYCAGHLLRCVIAEKFTGTERAEFPDTWIGRARPDGVTSDLAALIDRHVRPTALLNAFHRRLVSDSKETPFPMEEIERERKP